MNIPEKMQCIEITRPGGPEVLAPSLRKVPIPKGNEVLIKVAAAGVNRPDCLQRKGVYPPPAGETDIPGLEVSGKIVSKSSKSQIFGIGDNVTALVPGGGYSEYVVTPISQCLPIPAGLSLIESAALPETCFTVWTNIFERGKAKRGESLLIHGGSSGIGTTAIQIASSLGIRVLVTAGNDKKCAACLDLGAEKAVNYKNEDFVAAAKDFDTNGVNLVLDMVGGGYIARNIKALAPEGRLINIAYLNGSKVELDFVSVMLKRLTLTGSTLRSQSKERKSKIAKALIKNIWPLIEQQKMRPQISQIFHLTDAVNAHRLMESSNHIGKILLRLSS